MRALLLALSLLLSSAQVVVAAPSHRAIVAVCAHRSTPPPGWGIAPFRWRAFCYLHGR
jgi:hypothetical protein